MINDTERNTVKHCHLSLATSMKIVKMCENRKQVKDNWGRIFEEKKKGNCISVHIFLLGRTGGDKSGSGARLNKKNSAGLISKERTGARQSANYSANLGNHPYKLDTLNPTATHRAQKNCLTNRKLLAVSFKSATKPESPSKKKKEIAFYTFVITLDIIVNCIFIRFLK